MKITDALTTEQVVFTSVFEHIERALPDLKTVHEARLLARLVESLLRKHSDVETNLAYVALDHVLDRQSELDRLHQDHEEIDGRLKRVRSAATCLEARQLLLAALRASREHFHREEQTVFPLIEKVLRGDTLTGLGQAWRQRQSASAS